jgi:hypothetical protein
MNVLEPTSIPTLAESSQPHIRWTPILLGAAVAAALSSIMIAFGTSVGLGVSSAAPTWRDASVALALLSGLYLIIQAAISFGVGGYIAGRTRVDVVAADAASTELGDSLHGLAAWAVAVLMGLALMALVGGAALNRSASPLTTPRGSAAEPLLSYELDRLLRPARRASNADLSQERAEAGRILLTSSSRSGVSADDRTYLVQLVGAITSLPGAEAEKRVDATIANSERAIARSRRSGVILAFSLATALLLGAVISWAAAAAGGRHRDGAPMPHWLRADALAPIRTSRPS